MSLSVWVENIEDLNTIAVELDRAGGSVGAKGAAVVRSHALRIEAIGKLNAPVDTGHLRNSIGTDFSGDGRHGGLEAAIGPSASYAPFVEFGTSRMAPAAFMGPALDRVGPDFMAAVEQLGDPFTGGWRP